MKRKFNFAGIIVGMMFFIGYQTPAAAEEVVEVESMIVADKKTEKELPGGTASVDVSTASDSPEFTDNNSKFVEIETMTITATKSEKAIDGVSASVVIVDQKEIEMMGACNLKGIFEKTPGLTIQYGTFPAASSASKSSVSIRGLGFFGTLFLIDGRRLANELPSFDLDRLPASMIERIEIIKGPMSVLYGADAVGGVINIITKKPQKGLHASIDVKGGVNSGGEAENANAGFDIRGKRNKFSYSLYANASSKRPYTEGETTNTNIKTPTGKMKPSAHTNPFISQNIKDSYDMDVTYREDSKVFTLGSRVEYDIAEFATMGAEFNYFDEELDGKYRSAFFPTNISPAPGMKIVALDTPVHSTDDNKRLDWGIDSKINMGTDLILNLRIYRSDYEKRNTTTAIHWQDMGYSSENDSEQTRMAMNANVVFTSYEGYGVYALTDSQLLTIGGEYREEEREATLFNNEGTLENRDIDYKAVYVQDEWQITDTLSAIFGGRYDDIENADSEETFMAGFVKNFSRLFNLRANFAQGYRTPNILELYFRKATPVGYNLGAEVIEPSAGKLTAHELDPEFTNTYEAALSGRHGGFNYDIIFFYNDIEDKIQRVFKTGYFTYENVSDAETKGLEASIGYQFENGLALNMNWLELDTENKETGKDLDFNPERTVSLNVDYQLNERLLLGMQTVYIGEQRYAEGTADKTTDDYTLVNLTASYAFGGKNAYEIYGGVNNVFDEDVDTIIGSNVGTYFFTGLRVSF